jgi:hypothetical protein
VSLRSVDEEWERVARAILATPGALDPDTRRAIAAGDDPADLAPLLDKVRRHAYRIVDADVAGLDEDSVLEGVLAAALGAALERRTAALEALG